MGVQVRPQRHLVIQSQKNAWYSHKVINAHRATSELMFVTLLEIVAQKGPKTGAVLTKLRHDNKARA